MGDLTGKQTSDVAKDSYDVSDPLTVTATLVQSPEHIEQARALIREAIERRRQTIVYALARRFRDQFTKREVYRKHRMAGAAEEGWERIESLSQLRSVVGGRFQNLKRKWIEAGFPLREHRGDRSGEKKKMTQDGWLGLSVWVSSQGHEVRLARPEDHWFFEVKKAKA